MNPRSTTPSLLEPDLDLETLLRLLRLEVDYLQLYPEVDVEEWCMLVEALSDTILLHG